MAGNPLLDQLLGNPEIRQIAIWQILQQLSQAILAPVVTATEQSANRALPERAISPDAAVDAVIKDHLSEADGVVEAALSGISAERFKLLEAAAGEPPGMEFLLEAQRRGFIPEKGSGAEATSLEQGIRESRIKNKWISLIEQMRVRPISASDAINAWVRGQISADEAKQIAYQNGLDEKAAQTLFNTTGRPPSPTELVELLRRGYIKRDGTGPGETSFQQGIFEGDAKNKWWELYAHLTEYLPPPRTVSAMIREGALDDAEGAELLRKAGLSDHLVEKYILAAHHQKTAASRELAKSDILAGYADRLLTHERTLALLEAIGWHQVDAEFEMALTLFRRDHALVSGAITRVKSLYIARKVDKNAVLAALGKLGVSSDQQQQLLTVWDIERAGQVLRVTAAEWASAAYYGIITPEEAIAELVALGSTEYDAWVRVSVRLHGPATDKPPAPDLPSSYTR